MTALQTPHSQYELTPPPPKKVAIGAYFQQLLGCAASKLIAKYIPDKVGQWAKTRSKGDAECVRSHWAHESVREPYRDASFARVSLLNPSFDCQLTH